MASRYARALRAVFTFAPLVAVCTLATLGCEGARRARPAHREARAQSAQDVAREPGLVQLDAALQADAQEQVERQEAGDGLRDLEVGSHPSGEEAEPEEEHGGREQIVQHRAGLFAGVGVGANTRNVYRVKYFVI